MMELKMRLGPAGMPIDCKGDTLSKGIEYTASEGLNAFEVEFVKGVRGKKEEWVKAKKTAEKNDVLLSCHAPYWINCCSPLKEKQQIAIRNLLQTAQAAELLGAYTIVFHPGYYQKQPYEQAAKNCVSVLKEAIKKMKEQKLHCILGAETTGKPSAFGSLQENIELAKTLKEVRPVIDFAHLHARTNGGIKTEQDYNNIFTAIKEQIGSEYLKQMHCHFTEVHFSEKGERWHIPIGEKNSPDMKMLARIIKNSSYKFTLISESPLLDKDALKMKNMIINS